MNFDFYFIALISSELIKLMVSMLITYFLYLMIYYIKIIYKEN